MAKKNVVILLVIFVIIAGAAVGAIFFLRRSTPDILPAASPLTMSYVISAEDNII